MKKLLSILVVCLLIFAIPAQAQFGLYGAHKAKMYTYESPNQTGDGVKHTVPSTLIKAGSKILGYSIFPYDITERGELWLTLADTVTDQGVTALEALMEIEAEDTFGETRFFDYPLIIETGLELRQGSSSRVFIYYEK